MKTVILLFAYVALIHFATAALDNGHVHEHGHNPGLEGIHSFHVAPGSIIVIQKLRDGEHVPGHFVYGTLQPMPRDELPSDDNDPYGHAFVVIDERNHFHARLGPGTAYPHNNNDGNNTPDENREYHCWLGRPDNLNIGATLYPLNEGHNHDIPHVHYTIDSRYIHVIGELHHLPPDAIAEGENERNGVS